MDEKMERILVRGSAVGACGASFGGVLATFRPGASVPFYMLSMGTNYSIMGFTYFGFLEMYSGLNLSISEEYGKYTTFVNRHVTHVASGASTGLVWATIFAGPRKGIQGSLVFGLVGLAGSLASDKLEEWRREKGKKLRAEMQNESKNISDEI